MYERVRRVGLIGIAAALCCSGVVMAQEPQAELLSEVQEAPAAETETAETPRPADEILAEYDAIVLPEYDAQRRRDAAYQADFMAQRTAADRRRIELIGELVRDHPDHPRVAELLPVRWVALLGETRNDEVIAEAHGVAQSTDDTELRLNALYVHAIAIARTSDYDPARVAEAARLLYEANPLDPRNATLLSMSTINETESSKALEVYRRLVAEYPDTREGQRAADKVFQYERIGTPVELVFGEATTGEPVDLRGLRGRVIVLVFWASWSTSCRTEMPRFQALHEAYAEKGVSFIGVSLDQPRDDDPARDGLTLLRNWIADNGITWPQYYQGNGWDSPFSREWRVRSIPAVFVIDREGRLVTPDARGRLENLIPGMLEIEPRTEGNEPGDS